MAGRRLLLYVVLLLAIGAIASATVPRERRARVEPPLPAPVQLQPASGVVQARIPGAKTVHATVGEVVQVAIRSRTSDVAEVPALGVSEPVGPGLPGQLEFDANEPGRFAVTLRDAAKRIGTVVVRPAG
jgi:heme/copper-type cytochrome/quinol oxidase subunit 2